MFKRIERLQEILQAQNIDGAVYGTSGNLQYLLEDTKYVWQHSPDVGSAHSTERSFFYNRPEHILYIPASGEPLLALTVHQEENMRHIAIPKLVCPYDMFAKELAYVISGKKIAVGMACETPLKGIIKSIDSNIEIIPGENLVEKMRFIKDADEIETLRRVAKLTDDCMEAVIPYLKPGITSFEVEQLLTKFGLERGAQDISFPPTCRFLHTGGERSQYIDGYPSNQPLREGCSIAFDFGYILDGYCSDFGRSFYCGEAPKLIKNAYVALQEAQLFLLSELKPGVRMGVTYDKLYDKLCHYGYERYLRNYYNVGRMGHFIGTDVHENIWLDNDLEDTFQPGMVMAIEPKVWMAGQCFIRVEDMVLITEEGCESLTKFDRKLFSLKA